MRVLIIGGTGFIGSYIVDSFIAEGISPTLLNRGSKILPHLNTIFCDRKNLSCIRAIHETFDVVVDTCSFSKTDSEHAYRYLGGPDTAWIQISSASVYDDMSSAPSENCAATGNPNFGDYGKLKAEADDYLVSHCEGPVIVLRPPYVYGPGNNNPREQFVWSRSRSNAPIGLQGDGSATVQFVHAADLAALVVKLARQPVSGPAIYNVAAPETISLRDWVDLLLEINNANSETRSESSVVYPPNTEDVLGIKNVDCVLDCSRLFAEHGWMPAHGLREGFQQTFVKMKSSGELNPDRCQ